MSSSTKTEGDLKKFMFDANNFEKAASPGGRPAYSEDQMTAAKAQSHAQGKADGLKEARQSQEEQMLKCLQKIAQIAEKMVADEDRREIESMSNATKLAMKVTHKLLPQFAQKFSLQEIERVILQSLEVRKDEPRIAVTVPAAHMETLKSRLDALAQEKSYGGKLILLSDDHLSPADCRVEWADGGAERLYERLFAQVENEFAKAIAGMQTVLDKKEENN